MWVLDPIFHPPLSSLDQFGSCRIHIKIEQQNPQMAVVDLKF